MASQEQKDKQHLNLVVIGHVDSGKSTTTGHLLLKFGGVDQRTLDKFEQQAKIIGKTSFKFAWIFDNQKAERERGITIDVTTRKFRTKNHTFSVIDAPGHRGFIKNMITGASQADVALLVISSRTGEFERGFSAEGQTCEHTTLVSTLGVKQIIVLVNKIDDLVDIEPRYMEIKHKVSELLKQNNYDPEKVPFIPISGFNGDNLQPPVSDLTPWYKGPTVAEALDSLKNEDRSTDKPLRIPLQNVYRVEGIGTVPVGRVEFGEVRVGMPVVFSPGNIAAEVKSIEMHNEPLEVAGAGANIAFNVKGVSHKDLRRGFVCGDAKLGPPKTAASFEATVTITNHPGEVQAGYTPHIDCHTSHTACTFTKILARVDENGVVEAKAPHFLLQGQTGKVLLTPRKPVCLELFKEYPPLGRFAIRDMKHTVGMGYVYKINWDDGTVSSS